MLFSETARPAARRRQATIFAVVAIVIAVLVVAGHQSLTRSSPSLAAPSSTSVPQGPPSPGPAASSAPSSTTAPPPPLHHPDRPHDRGVLDEGDGAVPGGVTVFDGEVPAVANLDTALLGALRRAATAAGGAGVTFSLTSGWRSRAYQDQLLTDAVSRYGSEKEAARWVATPDTSAHVSGDAVDIGAAAAAWLSRHGAEYGLCQIYRNESWHYELRPEAIDHGCPPMYANPTQDPRMQR